MIMKDPIKEKQKAKRAKRRLEQIERQERNNKNNTNKVIIAIAVAIFLIIFILVYGLSKVQNSNYNDIKENKNKDLVYTRYTKNTNDFQVDVPYVNIDLGVVKGINEDITLFVNDFMDSNKALITYQYDINGHILSLLVQIVDYDVETVPQTYFRSYNINISNGELLSEQALLDYYGINKEQVENIIKSKFQDYYNDEVEEGYIDKNYCDMSCFLKYRDMEGYTENLNYYIKEGKLYIYKPFQVYSILGEEEYYKDSDFEFLIAHQPTNNE